MIYFDNSATGGFKPSTVKDSAINAIKFLNANPGRSGHRLSVTGADAVFRTRNEVAKFFGASPERVIFTKNCTEALNLAILGTVKKGGHIITTVYEHNSVLRPLYHLKNKGDITLTVVSGDDLLTQIQNAVTDKTYLVIVSHVSNVTGKVQDIKEIGEFCKKKNLLILSDCAQSAGHIRVGLNTHSLSMLTFAGHKGMYGIMGVGGLVFSEDIDINPIMFGGTGTESFSPLQPDCYPEKLESGTLNLPAISSLYEGVLYLNDYLTLFSKTLYGYTEKLIDELSKIKGIKIYSTPNESGIVSFLINDTPSNETADILSKEYDIAVRGGLHCAPLMHEYLNTQDTGLVRISLCPQNTLREINAFIHAIKIISEK